MGGSESHFENDMVVWIADGDDSTCFDLYASDWDELTPTFDDE